METPPKVVATINNLGEIILLIDDKVVPIKGALISQHQDKMPQGYAEVCVCLVAKMEKY